MSDIPSQVDGNLVINLLLQEHAESESLLKRKILGLQLDLIRANEEIGRLRQRMAAIEENVDANQRDGADRGSQPRPNGGGEPEAGAQHRGVG